MSPPQFMWLATEAPHIWPARQTCLQSQELNSLPINRSRVAKDEAVRVARWIVGCLVAVTVLSSTSARANESGAWNPAKTWVFAVGLLEWQDANSWPPFPTAKINRRDEQLVHYFERAGIARDRIVYLQDAVATKAKIHAEFDRLLDRTQAGDLLVFYFCGHGWRDRKTGETCFVNYETGGTRESAWNVREIFSAIEQRFHGRQALLMADCCHSGALYDEAKKLRKSHVAYAVLTSSSSHNSSTGQWTFSDSLLAGLRGESNVDLDGDQVVTLSEMAQYTETEMAFVSGQKSMFCANDGFPSSTVVARAKPAVKPNLGNRIEVFYKDRWYKAKIIDADGSRRKIHYVGFDSSWDEWVEQDRRRPYQPPQFAAGDKVQVKWSVDKQWYPATVRETWYGLHLVRYDGYGASADEWIGPNAIRLHGDATE